MSRAVCARFGASCAVQQTFPAIRPTPAERRLSLKPQSTRADIGCNFVTLIPKENGPVSASSVTRLPADIHASAKAIAAMQGRTPGEVIAQAWREFVEHHADEFAADFERAAALIREGDTEGLAAHANRFAAAEAEAALEAADLQQ